MDSKLQDISNDIKRVAGTADSILTPVMSGKVVAGSIDESIMTVSVLLTVDDNRNTDDAESVPTEAVLLSAVSMNNNGLILYPADDSDVIVAEVDGPGQYTLIKCSTLKKAVMKIEDVAYTMDANHVEVKQSDAVLTIQGGKFSLKNGSQDFKTCLDTLIQDISLLTVSTSTGPSGTPINAASFTTDKSNFDNLFFTA